jgi:hypothetical protein
MNVGENIILMKSRLNVIVEQITLEYMKNEIKKCCKAEKQNPRVIRNS